MDPPANLPGSRPTGTGRSTETENRRSVVWMAQPLSRRRVLQGLVAGTGLALTGGLSLPTPAGAVRGRSQPVKPPGTRPDPTKPEGVDLLPQIEHIVIYMQENHSFDSYFGMLGRGDGYTLGANGAPTNANPDAAGNPVRVFHAPDTCQSGMPVTQSWNASHQQFDGGRLDGFVRTSGPNAMRYWDGSDIPFYYGLANTFVLCDRWFGSCLAQTFPNRMYLQAATSLGLISTDIPKAVALPPPKNGTIWERLNAHGIPWRDYAWDLPDVALFPPVFQANQDKVKKFPQFLTDCAAGTLPTVSIVTPGVDVYNEERPHDIHLGEAYSASVINAVMHGPAWPKTVVLFMYDEHGGYYDHVPPPAAIAPDGIPPDIDVPPDQPGGFDRYGFRVPGMVISPFSKKDYVSHVVHDHTSVLRFIETKFNLGALTYRDANASDLLDTLDLSGRPAFLDPPELPAPGLPASGSRCEKTPAPPTGLPTQLARTGTGVDTLAVAGGAALLAGAAALAAERRVERAADG